MFLRVVLLSLVVKLGYCFPPNYAYRPSLSIPERHPELGLYPRYEALVYNYVDKMAGPISHQKVQILPIRIEDFGTVPEPALSDAGEKEPVTENPVAPSSMLPSDFILLAHSPQSQFFGNFDVVKNRKMKPGVEKSALPPLGGIVSNYVLLRGDDQKVAEKVKRQVYHYESDDDDGVIVNASSEPRVDNSNVNATDEDKKEEELQPSVAQSKPAAIALAGVGGVAQAAPVGTAVVGQGGLAIAAPSATAVAGQGTQGALQIASDEKMRKSVGSEKSN